MDDTAAVTSVIRVGYRTHLQYIANHKFLYKSETVDPLSALAFRFCKSRPSFGASVKLSYAHTPCNFKGYLWFTSGLTPAQHLGYWVVLQSKNLSVEERRLT